MKTKQMGPKLIVVLLQPSDEKAAQMCKAISDSFDKSHHIKIVEYGHSKNIEESVRHELYAWTAGNELSSNTEGKGARIIFISCHSGIEKAIRGKKVIQDTNARKMEGKSANLLDARICIYSTEPLDVRYDEHVTHAIPKDPNDETHQNVIDYIRSEYTTIVDQPDVIGQLVEA